MGNERRFEARIAQAKFSQLRSHGLGQFLRGAAARLRQSCCQRLEFTPRLRDLGSQCSDACVGCIQVVVLGLQLCEQRLERVGSYPMFAGCVVQRAQAGLDFGETGRIGFKAIAVAAEFVCSFLGVDAGGGKQLTGARKPRVRVVYHFEQVVEASDTVDDGIIVFLQCCSSLPQALHVGFCTRKATLLRLKLAELLGARRQPFELVQLIGKQSAPVVLFVSCGAKTLQSVGALAPAVVCSRSFECEWPMGAELVEHAHLCFASKQRGVRVLGMDVYEFFGQGSHVLQRHGASVHECA